MSSLHYHVLYCNRVEQVETGAFAALDEAINYCREQVANLEPFTGDDSDRLSDCHYEVYDFGNGDGENLPELTPVYETELFWER